MCSLHLNIPSPCTMFINAATDVIRRNRYATTYIYTQEEVRVELPAVFASPSFIWIISRIPNRGYSICFHSEDEDCLLGITYYQDRFSYLCAAPPVEVPLTSKQHKSGQDKVLSSCGSPSTGTVLCSGEVEDHNSLLWL